MPDTCPRCGAEVLTGHKAGKTIHLDAQPAKLGVLIRDHTGHIRARHIKEVIEAVHNGNTPGHHVHQCTRADQTTLF